MYSTSYFWYKIYLNVWEISNFIYRHSFISFCTSATDAAKKAVIIPISATILSAIWEYSKRGETYILVYRINKSQDKIIQITSGYNYDENKPTIKTKLALDISKVKKLFGWKPKVKLDSGIEKTIDWYTNN